MEKIKIPDSVLKRAANASMTRHDAPAAPPASAPSVTRTAWYGWKYGGGMRTARKQFTCQTPLCLRKIQPGEAYLDTCEVTDWPKTKRLCAHCAEELV